MNGVVVIMSLGMFLSGNTYSGLLKPNSELLLWEPKHGARKRGRPATTYVDQLRNGTDLSITELKSIMRNRKEWMKLVNGKQVSKQNLV